MKRNKGLLMVGTQRASDTQIDRDRSTLILEHVVMEQNDGTSIANGNLKMLFTTRGV